SAPERRREPRDPCRSRAISRASRPSARCGRTWSFFASIAVIVAATDTIAVVELAHFGAAERARSQQIFQQVAQRVDVRGTGAGCALERPHEFCLGGRCHTLLPTRSFQPSSTASARSSPWATAL